MNRRRAITRLLLLGGAGAAGYTGIYTFRFFRSPDLRNLSAHQLILDELAEIIIPETDTPGAKEAAVGKFIIKMVRDCTPVKSQNKFMRGLDDLSEYTASRYRKSFTDCTVPEKTAVLQYFQKKGRSYNGFLGKVERKLVGDSFFTTLKKYTVLGYCTSRPGATGGLAYDYIPGKYARTPLKQGQKAWATQ